MALTIGIILGFTAISVTLFILLAAYQALFGYDGVPVWRSTQSQAQQRARWSQYE
jgi:hypothetical protein